MNTLESVLCPITGLPFGASRAEALEYATHLVRVGQARSASKDQEVANRARQVLPRLEKIVARLAPKDEDELS